MLRFWNDPDGKHRRLRAAIAAAATTSVLATASWGTVALTRPAFASATASAVDPSTLPPAPPGFTDQLVEVYAAEYALAQRLGVMERGAQLVTVEDYRTTVASMSAEQLAVTYYATQQVPTWSQIPSLLASVSVSGAASTSPMSGTTGDSTSQARAAAATSDGAASPATRRTAAQAAPTVWVATVAPSRIDAILLAPTVMSAATAFQPSRPVVEFQPEECPFADVSSTEIFALKIASIAAQVVYDTLIASVIGASGGIAAAILFGALEITITTLEHLNDQNGSCEGDNLRGFIETMHNTTYQSWGLLNTMSDTVTDLETTTNTINNNLTSVTTSINNLSTETSTEVNNQLTTVQNSIETIMANDTSTVLNLVQNVHSLVGDNSTSISRSQTALNTAIIDARSALEVRLTTLGDALGRSEDKLMGHITFQAQRVLDSIAELKGQDTEHFRAALRVAIETALANANSSATPVGVLQLPASAGGYLDAQPVGVKQIVTDILEGMKATNQSFNAGGVKYLNSANDALAAGQYKQAWLDYATAYGFLTR